MNCAYYSNRAATHMMLYNFSEALDDSRKSVQLNPSFSKVYYVCFLPSSLIVHNHCTTYTHAHIYISLLSSLLTLQLTPQLTPQLTLLLTIHLTPLFTSLLTLLLYSPHTSILT